jgi:hypothetical protein
MNWKGCERKPGGDEEDHEKSQSSWSPGQDSNPGLPEYEGVLTTRARYSATKLEIQDPRIVTS